MKQVMNQCICQYYKVVEKAIVIPSKGYRIEGINKFGNNTIMMKPQQDIDYSSYSIDHQDSQAHWYRSYFSDENVYTFFGYEENEEPALISIHIESTEEEQRQYRLIYRTKNLPDQHTLVPDSFLFNEPTATISSDIQDSTWKTLIESNFPEISFSKLVKMDHDQLISSGIQDEILRLDENSVSFF